MTQLVVSNVEKQFGGLKALRGVSFSIKAGELVAIIGPNGAGKSTLINCITGENPPTAGSVSFKNNDIGHWPPYRVNRAGVARTFQAGELFNQLTVLENVIVGGLDRSKLGFGAALLGLHHLSEARRSLEARAHEALRLVSLSERANELAAILPAGQQRLLAIARALASDANWIILDEPAAGLNREEKDALIKVIEQLAQKLTVIFVEHDMRVVSELARRIIVLDQGELIADDKPEVVRQSERVISAYLGTKAAREVARLPHTSNASKKHVLRADQVVVRYGQHLAVDRVSIDIFTSEILAIVGANGAGKSSLLKAVMRTVPLAGGKLEFEGRDVGSWSTRQMVTAGAALTPESRELFGSLTVSDNLRLGAYTKIGRLQQFIPDFLLRQAQIEYIERSMQDVLDLFPRLAERRHQLAGTLSGGEGQMLAIGRALMSRPRILLLDEPSLGLAPKVIAEIFEKLTGLKAQGLTICLVEQNAAAALEISDRAYVMSAGRVVASGTARDVMSNADVSAAYLGKADAG
jgi:branched-chain amino acid transport system ATP-binding protein